VAVLRIHRDNPEVAQEVSIVWGHTHVSVRMSVRDACVQYGRRCVRAYTHSALVMLGEEGRPLCVVWGSGLFLVCLPSPPLPAAPSPYCNHLFSAPAPPIRWYVMSRVYDIFHVSSSLPFSVIRRTVRAEVSTSPPSSPHPPP
jgi:hypothetical protein